MNMIYPFQSMPLFNSSLVPEQLCNFLDKLFSLVKDLFSLGKDLVFLCLILFYSNKFRFSCNYVQVIDIEASGITCESSQHDFFCSHPFFTSPFFLHTCISYFIFLSVLFVVFISAFSVSSLSPPCCSCPK